MFPRLTESSHHSHVGALQVHPASGVFKVPSTILHSLNDNFQRITCSNHAEAVTPVRITVSIIPGQVSGAQSYHTEG